MSNSKSHTNGKIKIQIKKYNYIIVIKNFFLCQKYILVDKIINIGDMDGGENINIVHGIENSFAKSSQKSQDYQNWLCTICLKIILVIWSQALTIQ